MIGGAVAAEQYYRSPDGHFWWRNMRREWIGRPQADFKLKLKAEGLCTTVMDGEKMSELERQFLLVSAENGVDYAGLIAGWKPGYYERDGTRYLISREIPPLSAADPADYASALGSWPSLARLIMGVCNGFDEDDPKTKVRQVELFLGWWRHSYLCLQNNDPRNGLALVMAGDAGCGKTLLKEFIRLSFGGKEAQPYRWFTGQEQFNGNLMQSPLWTVDDEQADTSIKARNHFGAKLKLCVANAGVPFRAMHRDELTLYPFRRIVVCVNREPERLMVLPPLVSDVVDKMLILKCYNNKLCDRLRLKTDAEKAAFFQQAVKELPYFLHWLANEWEVPSAMSGRFGVPHWCHPEIERELFTLSPNQRLWDLIRKYIDSITLAGAKPIWTGGAKMLHSGMTGESSCLSEKDKKEIPAWNWLGQRMKQLAKQYPDALSFKRGHSTNEWTIDLSNYLDPTTAEDEDV
jgi:hypothetical protein